MKSRHYATLITITALFIAVPACGSSEPQPASPATARSGTGSGTGSAAGSGTGSAAETGESAESAPSYDDAVKGCVAVMNRQGECVDDFIPTLVDLRIKHDKPAGIAAEGSTPEGRDNIIASAKQEFAEDSTPESREQLCHFIVAGIPTEQRGAMMQAGEACLAADACGEFVACIAPFQEARLAGGK